MSGVTFVPGTVPVLTYVVEATLLNGEVALYGAFQYEDEANEFALAFEGHPNVTRAVVCPVNGVQHR